MKLSPTAIRPDQPDHADPSDKLPQIARDVGSATRVKTLAGDLHHGNRSFRRNAAHFPPDELVEHQVANDENPFREGARKNFL